MEILCCGCDKKVGARLTDGGEIYRLVRSYAKHTNNSTE